MSINIALEIIKNDVIWYQINGIAENSCQYNDIREFVINIIADNV